MKRKIVLWMGAAVVATAQIVCPGLAIARVPFGGENGKGADGNGLMSGDGANVALYEWSTTQNAAVLIDRWFDPSASSAPLEPDEFDVTHQFFSNTLSCGWNPPDPGRPPVTMPMVPVLPGPAWGGFLLVRSTQNGSGAPSARARWLPRVQARPRIIEAPQASCSGVDAMTRSVEAHAIIRADEPGENCINCRYTIIYSGGERHDWRSDSLTGPIWPDGDRGCYTE